MAREKVVLNNLAIERWGKPYEELSEAAKDLIYAAAVWKGLMPQTIIDGEPVPPQYRHLVGLINEPLPEEAY